MKKPFSLAVAMLFFAWIMLSQPAACAESTTPQTSAKIFYSWYIELQSKEVDPLMDKGIYAYVLKATVDRLREDYHHHRLPNGVDYFIKVQDYEAADWARNIEAHPSIMLGDVALVPVTLGSTDKVSVLVFLKKYGSSWMITKVDDMFDYQ